ncbi:type I-C CRISPR-associated protein Cas5c [Candidatus Chloroploca asiatica]|uniref:pre-crRNA processing endonuclease n=1 Tax=Candidatus Chloroploca asiatica TaxID=1506545 RepID=A0A2H3L1B0_9CHLR|nr:type I-C CRISPR-associated protein Cas5c [Candidatus Chloroploca asiatica]PDV96937.1 type I-C CRISPR-associated protein Cas5 [Candidatus Chloroploca asiatica]
MEAYPPVAVRVWGDFACFTRPEMKVERVSYPVMTPSAARGFLEAIFWKPEFDWRIVAIHVLKPIRYFSILRNEIKNRQSERTAKAWQQSGGGYDATSDRAQRHTLALRQVDYVIEAQVMLRPHADADVVKYRDQLRRRVREGRCFTMPYLGCREFTASFAEPDGSETPIELSGELGPMLFDLNYAPDRSGRGTPRFFNARLERGILSIPSHP